MNAPVRILIDLGPPPTLPRRWMSIGDVVGVLGEPDHVVRFWCDRHRIRVKRTRHGQRRFHARNVEQLRVIQALRNAGLKGRAVDAYLTAEGLR